MPVGQEYSRCVATLHPSWMLAHSAFVHRLDPPSLALAVEQSRQLGYEFFVLRAEITSTFAERPVVIQTTLRNTGIAPFYYDWSLEMTVVDAADHSVHTVRSQWSLSGLISGDPDRLWSHEIPGGTLQTGSYRLLLRVVNRLERDLSLRFANTLQAADREGWLTLGTFSLHPPRSNP